MTIRLAESAANDDVSDSDIKDNRAGKTGAIGTDFKTLTASVIKSRFGTENKRAQFILEANTGLVKYSGLFKLLRDYELISQSGSRYSCPTLWSDSFYKKDFIEKFIQNEDENVDKLQAALDEWEEASRTNKLNRISSNDIPLDDTREEDGVEEDSVEGLVENPDSMTNDMISAIER